MAVFPNQQLPFWNYLLHVHVMFSTRENRHLISSVIRMGLKTSFSLVYLSINFFFNSSARGNALARMIYSLKFIRKEKIFNGSTSLTRSRSLTDTLRYSGWCCFNSSTNNLRKETRTKHDRILFIERTWCILNRE